MGISLKKISQFLFRENRMLVVTLAFLVAFSFGTYTLAVYYPGDTNDPSCAPGTAGCYVAQNSFSTGLTNTSGVVTNDLLTGISGGQTIIGGTGANDPLTLQVTSATGGKSSAAPAFTINSASGLIASVPQIFTQISSTINQSGAGGYTTLQITSTETATGSGSNYLINALAGSSGSTSKFSVSNTGAIIAAGTPTFSTMTSGSVLFSGTAGILSQDNSNFFWDSTNHRLGIGTITPLSGLHIASGGFLQTQLNPTVKGSIINSALAGGIGVDVVGQYAYVAASSNSALNVVDISNPASPTLVGTVQDFTQLAGAFYVKVVGKYAYVTADSPADRLTVVDISNPYAPTVVTSLHDATNLYGVRGLYISGKYAFSGSFLNDRLTVIDISNPAAPVVLSTLADSTNLDGPDGMFVSGNYAYITAKNSNALTIYNISNPESPTFVGTVSNVVTLSGLHEVYVSGKYAYVSGQGNTFAIIDVSNPASPSIVSSIQDSVNLGSAKGIYVSGKYAYVTANAANRITVIDISSPDSPSIVGTLLDNTNLSLPRDVKVVGKYAYVAMNTGFTVIDLNGIDTQGANIGSLASQSIYASENAEIGNNLYVRNGLNVGYGGIHSNGPLSVQGFATGSTSAFDARNASGAILLHVQNDGKVGVGVISPTYNLEVGTASISGVVARFTNSTGYCDVNPTTTSLSCSSDERLKTGITDISSSLDVVNRLRPVTYLWKTQTDTIAHPGFIAQEVEKILPEVVATDLGGYKSIGYSAIVPYLTRAIQELDIKIEPLTSIDVDRDGSLASLVRRYLENSVNGIRTLFADKVQTKELCLEDVCVTKTQLQQLLNSTGTSANIVIPIPTPTPTLETTPEVVAPENPQNDVLPSDIPADVPPETTPEVTPAPVENPGL